MITGDARAHALIAAFHRLRDPTDAIGANARRDLVVSTGLTPAMIEWCLQTSLPSSVAELINALAHAPQTQVSSPQRVAVILAGNVFTACIRALGWPLLLGAQVTAKAASHDDVLPRALLAALQVDDVAVAQQLAVTTFDRHDNIALHELLTGCDAVSVYGSDQTVDAVSRACTSSVRVIAHGHGVSAMFVSRTALQTPALARSWAERAALDIAAYDQRGCLSPHVIWIETAAAISPAHWGAYLADALTTIGLQLPRGPLPEDAAIAQAQWRGVRIACGEIVEGETFCVAIEDAAVGEPSDLVGPGYRNVSLRSCANADEMWSALTHLGQHLKALGVAGDDNALNQVATSVPSLVEPHVTRAGEMQTPGFDAPADGKPPWFGLR